MGQINLRNVDDDLHRKFKLLCATRYSTIKAEIVRLMQKELATEATKLASLWRRKEGEK